jgi:hypothetical protein
VQTCQPDLVVARPAGRWQQFANFAAQVARRVRFVQNDTPGWLILVSRPLARSSGEVVVSTAMRKYASRPPSFANITSNTAHAISLRCPRILPAPLPRRACNEHVISETDSSTNWRDELAAEATKFRADLEVARLDRYLAHRWHRASSGRDSPESAAPGLGRRARWLGRETGEFGLR